MPVCVCVYFRGPGTFSCMRVCVCVDMWQGRQRGECHIRNVLFNQGEKYKMTREAGEHINVSHLHMLVSKGTYVGYKKRKKGGEKKKTQTGFVSSFHIIPLSICLCYMLKIKAGIKLEKRASCYLLK